MGGSSKSQTVGYEYYMGVQLALTHGPVDAVLQLIGDYNVAWSGNVTQTSQVSVSAPYLFGGQKREGGWVGVVDVMMGEPDQPANVYLTKKIRGPVPAYRGLVTTVFRGKSGHSFLWSSGNPYFKSPWWRIARYVKGWSRGEAWYPTKAKIGRDMNPIHIIYECLTNVEWGMGYSPSDIDDTNFKAAADTAFAEGFGLSLLWMEQTSISDFIQIILKHIDANIRSNVKTGLFQIKLLRNDYDPATVTNRLNPTNIISLDSFQRTAWGDTANEVVVKYTNRDQDEATVSVQDLASIEAQGSLVSVTRDYVAIREPELAVRVATRDLNLMCTPLAKVSLICNRVAWDWDVTDVFILEWPRLGLAAVPMRIIKILKGDLINGQITIEAVEDVFGLPASSYVDPQPPGWVDPIQEPLPAVAPRAIEVAYWDIIRNLPAAEIDYLPEGYAFGSVLAGKPSGDSINYDLHASPNNSTYSYVGQGDFTPTGLLTIDLPRGAAAVTFSVIDLVELDDIEVGQYAYIDNEAFALTNVDQLTGALTATRAALDTVPSAHSQGARVYFADNGLAGYDQTQRTAGEVTYYKPLTSTGRGTLPLSQAAPVSITFTGRAERPYPPGNVTINGQYFPTKIYGGLTVNWAHRDRTMQTVDLVPFTAGNIGPEPGTTYRLTLSRRGGSVLATYSDITGTSWTYSAADQAAHGYEQDLTLKLESLRDDLTSWQAHTINIDRQGLGFRLGENLGGVA